MESPSTFEETDVQEPDITVPAHDCGMCDNPLIFTGMDGIYASFNCVHCGAWHTSKDCCAPTPTSTGWILEHGPVFDEASGIQYELWTDGWAVGYKILYPTGEVRYMYLNPSGDSDGGTPDVFLYAGEKGDPAFDAPLHYYETSLGAIDG